MVYYNIFLGLLLAYFIGSFSPSQILGKLHGINIKKKGSGNAGATNTFRILGVIPGIIVLILDVAKGLFVVTWLFDYHYINYIYPSINFHSLYDYWYASFLGITDLYSAETFFRCLFGLTVITGHTWPLFHSFNGGKGVATSIGVIFGLSVILGCVSLFFFVLSLLGSRTVSFSSLAAVWFTFLLSFIYAAALKFNSILTPFASVFFVLFIFFVGLLIFVRHCDNIEKWKNKPPSV